MIWAGLARASCEQFGMLEDCLRASRARTGILQALAVVVGNFCSQVNRGNAQRGQRRTGLDSGQTGNDVVLERGYCHGCLRQPNAGATSVAMRSRAIVIW